MKEKERERISPVQSLSRDRLFVMLWTAARQASLSITNSRSLLKLMSIRLVMPSNHLILCHPLLLLPSIFPSIRVFSFFLSFFFILQWFLFCSGFFFSNQSVLCIRWPKYGMETVKEKLRRDKTEKRISASHNFNLDQVKSREEIKNKTNLKTQKQT